MSRMSVLGRLASARLVGARRPGERARAEGRAPRRRREEHPPGGGRRRDRPRRARGRPLRGRVPRAFPSWRTWFVRGPRRAARRVAAERPLASPHRAVRRARPFPQAVRPNDQRTVSGRKSWTAASSPSLSSAPPGARGHPDARQRRPRPRVGPPHGRCDRTADDPRTGAGRGCRRRARVLRRRRVPAGVLRRARAALGVTCRRGAVRARRPAGITRALRERAQRGADDAAAKGTGSHFPARGVLEGADAVARVVERQGCLVLHTTPVVGEEHRRPRGCGGEPARALRDCAAVPRSSTSPRATRRPRARREGRARVEGARTAAWRRSARRELPTGASTGCGCSSPRAPQTQAERLTSLLRHQGCRVPRAARAVRPGVARRDGRDDADRSSAGRSRRARCCRPTGSCSSRRRRSSAPARTGARSAPRADGRAPVPRGPAHARRRRLRRPRRARDRPLPGARPQGRRGAHGRPPRRRVRERRQAVPPRLPPEPDPEVLGRRERAAEARSPRRRDVREDEVARGEGGPQDGGRASAPLRRAPGAARRRAPRRGRRLPRVRGDVPLRRDARPGARPSTTSTRTSRLDRPMDRLVCGDVGFGKTEVAIRAAFRVGDGGKQVALLCPTTVLAQQHFRDVRGAHARLPDHDRGDAPLPDARRSRTRPSSG